MIKKVTYYDTLVHTHHTSGTSAELNLPRIHKHYCLFRRGMIMGMRIKMNIGNFYAI